MTRKKEDPTEKLFRHLVVAANASKAYLKAYVKEHPIKSPDELPQKLQELYNIILELDNIYDTEVKE